MPAGMKNEGYQNIIALVSCAMLTFCAYTWQSGYSVVITAILSGCGILLYKGKNTVGLKDAYKDGDLWESLILSFILAFVILKRDMLPIAVPETGAGELAVWILLGSILAILQLPAIRKVNAFLHQSAPAKLQGGVYSDFFYKTVLFITVGILIAQTVLCQSTHIWLDEACTLKFIEPSYPEMMKRLAADVHPPLYYLIVKCIRDTCSLIHPSSCVTFIPKFVSLLPLIILVVLGHTVIRKQWGRLTGSLFSLAVVGAMPMTYYGTEIRMYSWAMLFVTIAYISVYQLSQQRKFANWAIFLFSSVCAAYTHYFAIPAVIPAYLYLLYIERNKPQSWIFCSVLSVLLYLPWLPIFISQVSTVRESYWISPIHYETILSFIQYTLPKSSVFVGILFIGYAAQQIRGLLKQEAKEQARTIFGITCLLTPYFVIAIGCTASWLMRPVLVQRYLVSSLGCFWLGLCILLTGKKRNFASCLFAVFVIFSTAVDSVTFNLQEWSNHQKHLQFLEFSSSNKTAAFVCDDGHASASIKTMTGIITYTWQYRDSKVFQVRNITSPDQIIQLSEEFERLYFVTEKADMEQLAAETRLNFEFAGDYYIDWDRKLYRIITTTPRKHQQEEVSP